VRLTANLVGHLHAKQFFVVSQVWKRRDWLSGREIARPTVFFQWQSQGLAFFESDCSHLRIARELSYLDWLFLNGNFNDGFEQSSSP